MERKSMNEKNMRRHARSITWVTSLSLLALALTGCAGEAMSTEEAEAELTRETEGEFASIGFVAADHEDLTDVALSFLKSSVLANLGDENEATDEGSTKYKSEYHFDNCRFSESTARLRSQYETLVTQLNPNAFKDKDAQRTFGRILHTMQDFYSHSNWVENQKTRGTMKIVPFGDFVPRQFWPGMEVGEGMIVLQKGIPSNWKISGIFNRTNKLPYIHEGVNGIGTFIGYGLITGTYSDNEDPHACVPGATIAHGGLIYTKGSEPVLAKDDSGTYLHDEAKSLARSQTREEFCRLTRLVTLRYGETARIKLNTTWGVSDAEYKEHCPTSVSKAVALISAALT